MKHKFKYQARRTRRWRIRSKLVGTAKRPRLCFFRSNRHFYVQIIDDQTHHTLVAYSTLHLKPQPRNTNITLVQKVAAKFAVLVKQHKIMNVVFDRSGYLYHGQVAAFADVMRKAGLKF